MLCAFVLVLISYFKTCVGLLLQERIKVGDEFVPNYSEFYNYHNVSDKMQETLSISDCTIYDHDSMYNSRAIADSDLQIRVVPPTTSVIKRWGTERHEIFNVQKIYMRTTENLCSSKPYIKYKRGGVLYAKGCLKMFKTDPSGKRVKVINRYAATLHPEHVRCDITEAHNQCIAASEHALPVPDSMRTLNSYPFLVTTKNALISRSGFLALPCGPFGLFASCEAVKYGVPSSNALVSSAQGCRDSNAISGTDGNSSCPFITHDRVFVMTQYDDTQIGQFILEALPKLVYHLDFLLANPDVKIHYGFTKRASIPTFVLPHNIFNWLGLGDRLVKGSIYGKEIYVPREGGCQDAGYNAWEVVTTRDTFLRLAGVDQNEETTKRSILIIKRTNSEYVANNGDYKQRRWPAEIYVTLLRELEISFPNHRIDIFSDSDKKLMKCRECQIKMFHNSDITIAIHGAGLTNTMFMKPGGIVVEVIPVFDTRHAPLTGIFPRLSSIIGLSHYTYYTSQDINNLNAVELVKKTLAFALEVGLKLKPDFLYPIS